MELTINGKSYPVPTQWQEESLLSFIHEQIGLTGTKFGCGAGLCGACTVLLDRQAQRSCVLPVAQAAGHQIRTIEGLADSSGELHPVQQAWLDEAVPQCGYCQAGQIMSTVAVVAPLFCQFGPMFCYQLKAGWRWTQDDRGSHPIHLSPVGSPVAGGRTRTKLSQFPRASAEHSDDESPRDK